MKAMVSRISQTVVVMVIVFGTLGGGWIQAQQLAHTQFIPVLARTAGVGGTQWVTDVTVYNATDDELIVGMQFLIADQANIYNPMFPNRFTIQPRETLIFEDALHTLLGYETNITGSLLLTADNALIPGNPPGGLILATTRIYNVGAPEGTFGQTVPALSLAINAAGTPSIVTGARNDSLFRSNLGIVSMALFAEITVHYRVRSTDGSTVAEGAKTIHSASMSQFSFSSLGVPKADGPLTVELWMDPADVYPDPCATQFPNMFIAYVSKVDGNPTGTGDAEFIYAAPTEPYDCGQ